MEVDLAFVLSRNYLFVATPKPLYDEAPVHDTRNIVKYLKTIR